MASQVAKARAYMIAAAVLWSTSGLFAKMLVLPGPVMAFYRALFAGIFLGLTLPRSVRPFQFRPAVVGMVLCFFVMNLSFVTAMTVTTAANAIFLQYTAPVWMILACRFWLKEKTDAASLISVGVGLVGVAIIVGSEATRDGLGVTLALVAGVSFGLLAVFLRKLRDLNSWWLTFLNHACAALLLMPLLFLFGWSEAIRSVTFSELLGLAAFGVLQMALPYVLFSSALKVLSPPEAGILALLEPLLNPVWAYFCVGEVPSLGTMTGGAVILGAIGLRYVRFPWRKTASNTESNKNSRP